MLVCSGDQIHQPSSSQEFANSLNELRLNEECCDIDIHCADGSVIKCHRVVLASASPYFRAQFNSRLFSGNTVQMTDFTRETVQVVILWMYQQMGFMREEVHLLELVKCADFLNMTDLVDSAAKTIQKIVTTTNAVEAYNWISGIANTPSILNLKVAVIYLLNSGDIDDCKHLTEVSCRDLLSFGSFHYDELNEILHGRVGKDVAMNTDVDVLSQNDALVLCYNKITEINGRNETMSYNMVFNLLHMKLVPFSKVFEYYDTCKDQYRYFSFLGNLFQLHLHRLNEPVDGDKWVAMSLNKYDPQKLSWIKHTDDFIPKHPLAVNSNVTIHICHHILVLILENWIMLIDLWNMERRQEFQAYDSEYAYVSHVVCRGNELYFFNEEELLIITINEKGFSISINHHTTAKVSRDLSCYEAERLNQRVRRTMLFEHDHEIVMCISESVSLEFKTLNTITMEWMEKYIISAENLPRIDHLVVVNDVLYSFSFSRQFACLDVIKIDKDSASGKYNLDNYEKTRIDTTMAFDHIVSPIKLINLD